MTIERWGARGLLVALAAALPMEPAGADKNYAPGVTDTEIKIGQTMAYSGPTSAFGTVGKSEGAYFQMVNERGGIHGRKLRFISLDDGYSPPKTVEQTRRLVEQDEVLLMFGSLGTAHNTAVQKYLNARKVPQLFIGSISNKWNDPKNFPWTMALPIPPRIEAAIYASYILSNRPGARIAVLYQNDDFGKDYLASLKEALAGRAGTMVVAEVSYEVTDPTVDSQVVTLKGSGADVLMNFSTPKAAAQVIRKVYDIGWKPTHFISVASTSVAAVLAPAGLEKSTGLISATFAKDPSDPSWRDDREVKEWFAWMKQYYPEGSTTDLLNVTGYVFAAALVQVLQRCGDDLSRENVMRQATNLRDVELPMLLPGVKMNTTPTDYVPFKQMQLRGFDGTRWVRFGEMISRP
jgi:branched-chain amino acid transport system substrate-binding protein